MMTRKELTRFLDELLLESCACKDSSNNGLQVEGAEAISKVIFGVDACLQLFEKAVAQQGDYIIVHHGMSWKDSLKYLREFNGARARKLFQNNLSLYAAHLPLDMHPEVGHNAQIADMLNLQNRYPCFEYGGANIGFAGELPAPLSVEELSRKVNEKLNTICTVWDCGPGQVKTVGVVSGGGADGIEECPPKNIDCLITGEVLHQHWHAARELGVNVIAAGHYRSEIPGLLAVKDRLEKAFDIPCEFIDIPTGL